MRKLKLVLVAVVLLVLLYMTDNYEGQAPRFTFDQNLYNKQWNDENEIWFGQSTAVTGQTKE